MRTVYLAGPEVFLPDGREVISRKRAIVETHGFVPTGPHGEFAAERDADTPLPLAISRRNERLMDEADFCIANLTPFRGVSADVGTVFEVGYMIGAGKPVLAYTADPEPYAARVERLIGPLESGVDGLRAPDGTAVEEHGWSDNLMMEGALLHRGFAFVRADAAAADPARDLAVFTRCVEEARRYVDATR